MSITGRASIASSTSRSCPNTGGTATAGGTDYTLPASPAVTFAAGTYATGLIRHGSDYVVTEVSVLRVAPDGAVDTVSYDGLFSPRRGDVSVQLASDVLASTSIGYYDTTPADDRVILKRVPEVVWAGSADVKRVFLQALFEGDGSSSLLSRSTIQISMGLGTRARCRGADQPRFCMRDSIAE